MRTTVAAVVMVMMCAMMVDADVEPQKDFNLQRFTGRWYLVCFAYDSPGFVPFRNQVKGSVGTVTALPNGDINFLGWTMTPKGCQRKLYKYAKTSVPGQFTFFSTHHKIVKDATVVDTNYNEYFMFIQNKVFNREYTQAALYGRTQTLSNAIIGKFKAFALSQGFSRESILTLPLSAQCPPRTGR